jgi:hypothetical protein
MPAQRLKPKSAQWAGLLFTAGLLLSRPAASIELHLDSAALPVPGFRLAAEQPLSGLERWQLAGAFHSSQAHRSVALISINQQAPQAVRPGEVIAQGIHLQAVFADHVLLRRGARSARLFLQQATGANAAQPAPIAAPAPQVASTSARCQQFSQAQVPREELLALGICTTDAY